MSDRIIAEVMVECFTASDPYHPRRADDTPLTDALVALYEATSCLPNRICPEQGMDPFPPCFRPEYLDPEARWRDARDAVTALLTEKGIEP